MKRKTIIIVGSVIAILLIVICCVLVRGKKDKGMGAGSATKEVPAMTENKSGTAKKSGTPEINLNETTPDSNTNITNEAKKKTKKSASGGEDEVETNKKKAKVQPTEAPVNSEEKPTDSPKETPAETPAGEQKEEVTDSDDSNELPFVPY